MDDAAKNALMRLDDAIAALEKTCRTQIDSHARLARSSSELRVRSTQDGESGAAVKQAARLVDDALALVKDLAAETEPEETPSEAEVPAEDPIEDGQNIAEAGD